MNRLKDIPALFAVLILLLSGCSPGGEPVQQDVTLAPATAEPSPTHLRPTPSPSPQPSSTPVPSPSPRPSPQPEPSPTNTPLPVYTLSVPGAWQERAQQAVARLNESAESQTWRLEENAERADVRLARDSSGIVVGETTLVLAVPFTTAWESVTYDEAVEIMEQGHKSVIVVPWPDLKPGQKAVRIDGLGPADEAYPLKEIWSLVPRDQPLSGVDELAQPLREMDRDDVIHLTAVGDIMLDRSLGYNLARGDLAYPFSYVDSILQKADITVGNMESALGDSGEPQPKRYPFRAPSEAVQSLALAGFDVVSLANNHGMDYGPEALLQALDLLQQQEVAPVGAGADSVAAHAPFIVTANGLTVAFFGYVNVPVEASTGFDTASWTAALDRPGLAWGDPQSIAADLEAVRDQVDLVVVLLHSGFEYQALPSEPQTEAAHAAVDAGADLVIGHHAHILQGIETYREGVIIYGTGNFAFDINGPPETGIFHIWLDENGVREIAIDPAVIQFGGQPRPAVPWEAPAILSRIYYLSDQLNGN